MFDETQVAKQLRIGEAALRRAINVEILEDMYLSDAVRDYVEIARRRTAEFSAEISTRHRSGELRLEIENEKEATMDRALYRLRNAMSLELRTAQDALRPSEHEWAR